jgi:hypothetical protein
MSRNFLLLGLVAVLAASPLVNAGWGVKGVSEPQTSYDRNGGFMFLTPDNSPSQAINKVYFAGDFGQCVGIRCTYVSPNLATLGTSIQTTEYNFQAVLGVWKDCNNDGYVGLGDQGLLEYRSTILAATAGTTICPVEPIAYGTLGQMPVHNDGNWVRELIPIGWRNLQPGCLYVVPSGPNAGQHLQDCNPFKIDDNGARVWTDFGVPGANYAPSCPIAPVAYGTFSTTGGAIKFADCIDQWFLTDTLDSVATGPLAPLSFADDPRDQENSHSILNQPNPWGSQSDASDAQVWDCSKSQTQVQTLGDAPLLGYGWVNVSQPKVPPSVGTGGSVAGTLNATGSGFDQCNRNSYGNGDGPQGLVWQNSGDHFHEGGALANAPYVLEYNVAGEPTKVEATDNLQPTEVTRPAAPTGSQLGAEGPSVTDGFGLETLESDGIWNGGIAWGGQWMVRENVNQPIGPVRYQTFYAYVSPTAQATYGLQMPKGTTTGTYGAETCGSATTGTSANNWQCNPALWYLDSLGHDTNVRSTRLGKDPNAPAGAVCDSTSDLGCVAYGARVGDPFNLRAVDCYDQSIAAARGAGVSWGTLTGKQCQ